VERQGLARGEVTLLPDGRPQTYQDDERFARNIGGDDPALVSYLCDGMGVYAYTRLS